MGNIMSGLKYNWIHDGICDFYDKISKNGYMIVYLSARSI